MAAAIFMNPTLTRLERFSCGTEDQRPGLRTLETILEATHMPNLRAIGRFDDDGDTRTLDVVGALTDRGIALRLQRQR